MKIRWVLYHSILWLLVLFFAIHFLKYTFGNYVYVDKGEKELIDYFNEITLGSEVGGLSKVTRRWENNVTIYIVKKKSYSKQVQFIHETIKELNELIPSDITISVTDDSIRANCYLYLGSYENVRYYNNKFTKDLSHDYFGYFTFRFVHDKIYTGNIFINTAQPLQVQKNSVLEELVQVLGFGNDSKIYPQSIFYIDKYLHPSRNYKLTKLDKKIIQLLYHPKMKVGLNRQQTEKVIKKIIRESE